MNSLEEEVVKARFQMKHKYYRFLDGTTFLQWDGMSPEDLQKVKDESYTDNDISSFNTIANKKCAYGLQH
ncbi:hypothetical protein B0I18_10776 [Taibaiella chishuiensis]|uniref:Uncharacterized protein n=1 Tax=Taibaiella chishuiensis TaxID=1434707 RepID=A0A2P8D0I2_9BACT|nr:hypothetical protein B0I18_10776 [Taibaiella chishuiensis]